MYAYESQLFVGSWVKVGDKMIVGTYINVHINNIALRKVV